MASRDHAPGAGAVRVEGAPREKPLSCPLCLKRFHVIGGLHEHCRVKHMPEMLEATELLADLLERCETWADPINSEAYLRGKLLLSGYRATNADMVSILFADGAERHDAAPDAASGRTPKAGG